jgi:hypothetical protein
MTIDHLETCSNQNNLTGYGPGALISRSRYPQNGQHGYVHHQNLSRGNPTTQRTAKLHVLVQTNGKDHLNHHTSKHLFVHKTSSPNTELDVKNKRKLKKKTQRQHLYHPMSYYLSEKQKKRWNTSKLTSSNGIGGIRKS